MIKFLDLQMQYESIRSEIDDAISDVLAHAVFVGGQYVTEFEERFAGIAGTRFCVGVGNGTDALELAIEALELPPHSDVIVPANTFIATAEAVTRTGHNVVFCDCRSDDYTVDVESLQAAITPSTRAVIAVHLYGLPCAMDEIRAVADRRGLKVIEDCAQAHGALYKGMPVGSLGDIAAFSFYPGKIIGAFGDAGAVTTNDSAMAQRVRMTANHGRTAKYDHAFQGRNSRLDSLQAAVLSVKLQHLDEWVSRRRHIAAMYRQLLDGVPDVVLPIERSDVKHAYHLFVIRTAFRDQLMAELNARGIMTGIHYPIALPKLEAFSQMGLRDASYVANQYDSALLSLPMGEHLKDTEVETVASTISAYFAR